MKILQVNNVYGAESTGKITQALHRGLPGEGFVSLVAYGRGGNTKEPGVTRLCPDWYGKANSLLAKISGMPYGGCWLSTMKLERLIRREKPDVVHLQCINGHFVNIYRLIRWLKRNRIKTVISLHGEFLYTANCGHAFDCDRWRHGCGNCPDPKGAVGSWFLDRTAQSWKRMCAAFRGFEGDCVICPVSPWVAARVKQSDILGNFPVHTVFNGVDGETFCCHGLPKAGKPTVLHVTAHFSPRREHPKGGWYLLELARRMPGVSFLVAGRAEDVPNLPENVKILGLVRDQRELAALYEQAALTLLLSRRETFSMVCAESLCCGTPVVGFEAGGPEGIARKEFTEFVPFGDLDALEGAVERWLAANPDSEAVAARGREDYGAERMVRQFGSLYRSLE